MKTIRASEVGEYVYCARAWWLRRVLGLEATGNQRRQQGTALHVRHGVSMAASRLLVITGVALLIGALALLLIVR